MKMKRIFKCVSVGRIMVTGLTGFADAQNRAVLAEAERVTGISSLLRKNPYGCFAVRGDQPSRR